MGASSSTLAGWAVILAVGGLTFTYYTKKGVRPAQGRASKLRHANVVSKKEPKENKPKRQRIEDTQRDSYAAKLKSQPPSQARPAYSSDDDADTDNREFARQLASVKQGTKFTGKTKDETRQKSVKQSHAQEMADPAGETRVSAPSSTAGIDADDDQSSAASPLVGATGTGGISDMLEQPSSGPSILRLTDTEEKKPKEKAKPKAPEPVESKKQRQNRKKAEAAKTEREEAENDRKIKLEAQRRTARQAEGRAAKDGSGFMAAKAASAAWTGNGVHGKTNGGSTTNGFLPVQPLDTFESNAVQTDASKSSTTFDKEEDWMAALPSEEEQMKMLEKQGQDEWETVKTKARKPKKKDAAGEESNGDTPAPAQPLASIPNQANKKPQHVGSNKPPKPIRQESSFAALSTDSPAKTSEEWDL